MQDDRFRRIDVHGYLLDLPGRNIGGLAYESRLLTGTEIIGGRPVRCIPVERMIEFLLGYEQHEEDFLDVLALCEQFDLPMPGRFDRFFSVSPIPFRGTRGG